LGIGVDVDVMKSAFFYEQSSEQGYLQSHLFYGCCFLLGKGVMANLTVAADLFNLCIYCKRSLNSVEPSHCSKNTIALDSMTEGEPLNLSIDSVRLMGYIGLAHCVRQRIYSGIHLAEAAEYEQRASELGQQMIPPWLSPIYAHHPIFQILFRPNRSIHFVTSPHIEMRRKVFGNPLAGLTDYHGPKSRIPGVQHSIFVDSQQMPRRFVKMVRFSEGDLNVKRDSERFRLEVRIHRELDHPLVIPYAGKILSNENDQKGLLITEYADNGCLRDIFESELLRNNTQKMKIIVEIVLVMKFPIHEALFMII
jgi:serine/threonine protein kinase